MADAGYSPHRNRRSNNPSGDSGDSETPHVAALSWARTARCQNAAFPWSACQDCPMIVQATAADLGALQRAA